MAETATPKLDVAKDASPYAPVSWAAVAAASTTAVYVVIFLAYGWLSFRNKQPLIEPVAFCGLPILAVVFAFVAWMLIRGSEGTRTGMKLTKASFWVALVLGLGYFAYLMAINLAVDVEAEKQFVEWAKDLNDLDPDNPADPALCRAFHKTMAPGLRLTVTPDDAGALERRFGTQIAGFRQSDLIGICLRNRGECKFVPQGLIDWKQKPKTPQEPATTECTLAVTLECPEGVYGLKIGMRATADDAGRKDWQLLPAATGLVQSARLTDYGRRVYELRESGSLAAGRFMFFAQDTSRQDRGYLLFVKSPYSPQTEQTYLNSLPKAAALALVGSMSVVELSVIGYEQELFDRVFTPVLGADAPKAPEERKKKETDMRKLFGFIWNGGRVRMSGYYNKDNVDKNPVLVVGEKQIELRFPVELGLAGGDAAANTARGRLVLLCDDPAVLAEMRKQKAAADPAHATELTAEMPNWIRLTPTWKVVRIESDLKPMPAPAQPGRDGMPPGMGGGH